MPFLLIRPLVLACALATLISTAAAAVEENSSVPYALIPPAVAERLKSEASSTHALHLLKTAQADLANKPNPLPLVHTEGTLPHQGIRDQSGKAERDWPQMLAFGMAYRLTGDPKYLEAAERFLSAWLAIYQVSFNPIDETNLDQMILAYDLTRPDLSRPTQEKMTAFLRTMAQGYLDKIAAQKTEDITNWQSHRIKLLTLSAFALGDPDLIARAHQVFQRQLSVNIRPDGSVVDFYKRDALHYVVYDLEPLATAALAAQTHGDDWFHPATAGAPSVEKAIDWLTSYALGQKSHQEFVHSAVAFDAARAKAGEKGYSGPWQPATSLRVYQLAAMVDPKYAPTMQQIAAKSGRSPTDWIVLLQQAGL